MISRMDIVNKYCRDKKIDIKPYVNFNIDDEGGFIGRLLYDEINDNLTFINAEDGYISIHGKSRVMIGQERTDKEIELSLNFYHFMLFNECLMNYWDYRNVDKTFDLTRIIVRSFVYAE